MDVFMRKKYERFVFVLIVRFVFAGCHKKENAATEENIENGVIDFFGNSLSAYF
jgi:hypothetical protein